MVKTYSKMSSLGVKAPAFCLPDITGKKRELSHYAEQKGLLVAFICNHCPFVKHINPMLVQLASEYQKKGIAFVAINSNDVEKYPEDSPDKMAEVARTLGYPFDYLFDETQQVAMDYSATCTPDFFFYGQKRQLLWRGRMDGSTPGNDIPVTGEEMKRALDYFLAGKEISWQQNPSIGCNIKWKC